MSIESNLYQKSIKILTDLIGFKTISGKDNGPLIDYCDVILKENGVSTFRVFDNNKERVNLFGTLKAKKTNGKKPIILSGHTDVVPVSKGWSSDPFIATIKNEKLYGRGSCDMKGFLACLLAYAPIFSNSKMDRDVHFVIFQAEYPKKPDQYVTSILDTDGNESLTEVDTTKITDLQSELDEKLKHIY